jgi:hypothetical protein
MTYPLSESTCRHYRGPICDRKMAKNANVFPSTLRGFQGGDAPAVAGAQISSQRLTRWHPAGPGSLFTHRTMLWHLIEVISSTRAFGVESNDGFKNPLWGSQDRAYFRSIL